MDTLFYAAASHGHLRELSAPAAAEGCVRGRGPGGARLPVRPAGETDRGKSHDETPEGLTKIPDFFLLLLKEPPSPYVGLWK